MKRHKDLISLLRSNKMRITPARRALLQFILDNQSKNLSLKDVHDFMDRAMPGVDRSSIYRNLEMLKKLDILQELNLPGVGKHFQYVFDRKVHHYFICKSCGKLTRGNEELFKKIEDALREVHGFAKANLSVTFYGYCFKCAEARETDSWRANCTPLRHDKNHVHKKDFGMHRNIAGSSRR